MTMSRVKITTKSCYAPIRFEAKYEELKKYFQMDKKALLQFKSSDMKTLDYNNTRTFLENKYPKLTYDDLFGFDIVTDFFIKFIAGGKLIYDINPTLMSALGICDINSLRCKDIKMPASAFYIHLGDYSEFLDGVFISEEEHKLESAQRIHLDFVDKDFGKTHFSFLEEEEYWSNLDIDISDDDDDLVVDMFNIWEENLESDDLKKCFPVILNTIFYINSSKSDVILDWGSDVPTKKSSKNQK